MEALTWDAVATLTTGILAVGSASLVAMKQVAIVRRQTLLQELSFRGDVFDKRMKVFNAVRAYMRMMMSTSSNDYDTSADAVAFIEAAEEARFLFSKKLYLELSSIRTLAAEIHGSISQQGWEFTDPRVRDEAIVVTERRKVEMRRRYHALPALFDAEMHISTADEGLSDYVDEIQLPDPVDDIDTITRTAKQRMAEWQSEGQSEGRII